MKNLDEVKNLLENSSNFRFGSIDLQNDNLICLCEVTQLIDNVSNFKRHPDLKLKQLVDILAIDYPNKEDRFEVVYLFLSHENNFRISIKMKIKDAEKFIASANYGASIIFTGTVRNQNNNKNVIGITYDSHDALVLKSFNEIYNETEKKLNIKDKAVFIEHAKGYLNLKEISIIIAVACKHRDEAYILSRYIIEEVKKRSPIWKKEHYIDNKSDWLKGNPLVHEKI